MLESVTKLKWRCRRGTKELDYLLEAYLDQYYKKANSKEQALFIELLDFQDTALISYLLGEQLPESKELTELVKKIRHNPHI
jgi:antitoxin CptB